MKKIVLSLAVLASVALVSCNKGAAATDSETACCATETEVAAPAPAETAAPAAETAAPAEVAPVADSAVAK